ncbi:MAG: dTDP-4-dehydrorhamnose 3,5-epimerase family protein [Frankiaceae bacterium]|nr:dTDP-4-dehydrorhamnose 3,5-epimerase family protein [Frankiaceae bacterium]
MDVAELKIAGSWVFTPRQFPDPRGVFLEWFKGAVVEEAIGHPFVLRQVNHSTSSLGTLRGIHYADVPPSQAKYVYVTRGAALDIIVDIRVGSPTFGVVESVRLDDVDRRAVYVAEGLGHAVIALTDDVNLNYLVTQPYAPERERGINPLDPALDLPLPDGVEPLLSDKDAAAPTLAEAEAQGLLPSYDACLAFYDTLRGGSGR